jgi:hypothetical protein
MLIVAFLEKDSFLLKEKCCVQVTICLEDKIVPPIRNTILARKL